MLRQENVFDKLLWSNGRMRLGDLTFATEDQGSRKREADEVAFTFLKPKRMIDQYATFWRLRSDFAPRHILELGIYEGGSLVFWFEVFRPDRLVALDIARTGESGLLQRYIASRGLQDRIKTYWDKNQADPPTLRRIVATDFSGRLDLVFDDASHLYRLSKVSFETLFPLLRPGGLYIIEDWSWACWSSLPKTFNPSMTDLPPGMRRKDMPLLRLISELVVATGKMEDFLCQSDDFLSLKPFIANVHVYSDFAVIERGEADYEAMGRFELERYLPQRARRLPGIVRRLLSRSRV